MSDRVVNHGRPTQGSAAKLGEAAQLALSDARRAIALVGEEIAGFRRRALQAESRIRELEERVGELAARVEEAQRKPDGDEELSPREAALVQENARMRTRLDAGTQRITVLLDRLRFIRAQGSPPE